MCAELSNSCRRERESRLKVLFMAITRNPQLTVGQLMLTAKLVSRWIRSLPSAGRFALLMLLLMCGVYYEFGNWLTSDAFLEVGKCPACFGLTVCSAARSGDVWFTGWSRIRLLDYVNVENIYTGWFFSKLSTFIIIVNKLHN